MIELLEHQKYKPTTENCALYWEMGVGKTFASLYIFKNHYQAKELLVVCPKSVIDDWKKSCSLMGIESATIINYDLVWRRKLDLSEFTLILDESSYIKNKTAKRTKESVKLAKKAKHTILLSGTPCGGRYEDLLTQINILGWDIKKSEFWDTYINYYTNTKICSIPIPIVTGYKNIARLKRNLRKYGANFKKSEEVISLPEQRNIVMWSKTTPDYKKFVKQLNNEQGAVITINDKELIGDSTFSKYLIKRQLCSIYSKEKQQQLTDLLNSTEERVVIFYNFNDELEILLKICKDRPTSQINGHTKDLSAYEEHDNSVVLCQYQSASMGVNLQKARIMIFYSPTHSAEQFEQAPKRIHRLGQKNTCVYYYLITKGSVEEDIRKSNLKGEDYNYKLFGGNVNE